MTRRPVGGLAFFIGDGGAELVKAEQPEGAPAGVVENAQIVALAQIVLDDREVMTIPVLDQIEGKLVGDELVDALRLQLAQQARFRRRCIEVNTIIAPSPVSSRIAFIAVASFPCGYPHS